MPIEGLPSTLETVMNQLLVTNCVRNYKIAANPHMTTVVIRFGVMADQSVDPCLAVNCNQRDLLRAPTPSPTSNPSTQHRKSPALQKRAEKRRLNFLASKTTNYSTFSSSTPIIPDSQQSTGKQPFCSRARSNSNSSDSVEFLGQPHHEMQHIANVNNKPVPAVCNEIISALDLPCNERPPFCDPDSTDVNKLQNSVNNNNNISNTVIQTTDNSVNSVDNDSGYDWNSNTKDQTGYEDKLGDKSQENVKEGEKVEEVKEEGEDKEKENSFTDQTRQSDVDLIETTDNIKDGGVKNDLLDKDNKKKGLIIDKDKNKKKGLINKDTNQNYKHLKVENVDGKESVILENGDILVICALDKFEETVDSYIPDKLSKKPNFCLADLYLRHVLTLLQAEITHV